MNEFTTSEAIGRYIMRNGRIGETIRVVTEKKSFEGELRDTGDSMEPGDVISATCELTENDDRVQLYADILEMGDMEMSFDVFAVQNGDSETDLGTIQSITVLEDS